MSKHDMNQGSTTPRRGAQRHHISFKSKSHGWLRHTRVVALDALRRMFLTPVATLMTLAVLAVSLALPGFLLTAVNNIQQFSEGFDANPRIALYLKTSVSDARAEQFSLELMLNPALSGVELIDREKGLQEFSSYSEFANLLELFDTNPLPAVVLALPLDHSPHMLQALQSELLALPEVEEAQLDLEWIQRLNAYVVLAERFSWVLSALLGLAVLLVVGNTLRMLLESRRDEILVAKLVGATDAWVRRPFLYSGFWYGLIGSLFAIVMVSFAIHLIDQPVTELMSLYASRFELEGLGFKGGFTLMVVGDTLGLLGGFLSTGHHLREIEPDDR